MFFFLGLAGFTSSAYAATILPLYRPAIGIILTMINLGCYATAALADPGIPKKNQDLDEELRKEGKICRTCHVLRAERTYHCFDCDVCVEEYDHHCPWTSKCIGRGNIRSFYAFVLTSMISLVYSMSQLVSIVAQP
eukprot:TRINITY_DN674_c0_g1_i3.p1 TRINITY_DN674_c0_g1~~TRINITY_DN674_c0_g1_i3.p1  ORF type:complete len:136 (-),score=7.36 TRINITY_DN674_c0_g1_i3:94-501(-)